MKLQDQQVISSCTPQVARDDLLFSYVAALGDRPKIAEATDHHKLIRDKLCENEWLLMNCTWIILYVLYTQIVDHAVVSERSMPLGFRAQHCLLIG
jgi:hypothetical protein